MARRPENFAEVLFGSLGAGVSALPGFLQQGQEFQQAQTQQSFLNRLREESAGREQKRLVLAQKGFGLQEERFGLQEEEFERRGQKDLFDAMHKLTTPTDGAGKSLFGVSTGKMVLDELGLGFKQRELGRRIRAGDPAFGAIDPETNVFTPRTDVSFDEISIPRDTLAVLLQQARQITGERPTPQLTPATNLSNLGTEQIFPGIDIAEGLPPMIGSGDEEWGRANIDDWDSLNDKTKTRVLKEARSQGLLQ